LSVFEYLLRVPLLGHRGSSECGATAGLAPGERGQDIDDIFCGQAQTKVPDGNLVTKETAPGDDSRKLRSSCRGLRTIDRKYGAQEFAHRYSVGEVVLFFLITGGGPRGGEISH
jgi:hypothetical protein